MIAILEVKHFFLMSDEQLEHWMEHGDKAEVYAASAEYNFRKANNMLEKTRLVQ